MKNAFINQTTIEGLIYEHALEMKVSGPNSKAPGTQFITGTVSVATDDACINIVPVHFTYSTATTSKGGENKTFTALKNIIEGNVGTIMKDGKEKAGKIQINSALGLNEFYTDRNGKEELVSAKRNEGGFVTLVSAINPDEKLRNTFTCDMLITGATRTEANPDKNIPEKVIVKGAIFDFRKALLPVEFSTTNPGAMNYFEGLGATAKEPVFTKVWGRQVSETVVNKIVEESAFGDASVREVTSNRKDFIITGASVEPYVFDDESTITVAELNAAISARELYLASVKQRQDEYKAQKAAAAANAPSAFSTTTAPAAAPATNFVPASNAEFNF